MEGTHDLGGIAGFGAVRTGDGGLTHHDPWELRAQALAFSACRGARPWIERLDAPTYLTTSYYGRWLLAAELGAVANEIVTAPELATWQARIAAGEAPVETADVEQRAAMVRWMTRTSPMEPAIDPLFERADRVRVRRIYQPDVHHRVPRYVRGVVGTVESVCGNERIAGYRANNSEPLYSVRFESLDVWGESSTEAPFAVHVDLWQSYLEGVS